jgi:hypothetical protein
MFPLVVTRLLRSCPGQSWRARWSVRPTTLRRALLGGVLWLGATSSSLGSTLTISGIDDGWVSASPTGFRLDMSFDRMTDDRGPRQRVQGWFTLEAGPRTAFIETSGDWWFHHGPATWSFDLTWKGRTGRATGTMANFVFGIGSPYGDSGLTWDTVALTPVFSSSMRRLLRSDTTGSGWLDWIADGWHHTGYDPYGEMDSRIYTRGNERPLELGVTAPLPVPEPTSMLYLLAAGATATVMRRRRGGKCCTRTRL